MSKDGRFFVAQQQFCLQNVLPKAKSSLRDEEYPTIASDGPPFFEKGHDYKSTISYLSARIVAVPLVYSSLTGGLIFRPYNSSIKPKNNR